MRQISRKELEWDILIALRLKVKAGMRNNLASRIDQTRRLTEQSVAVIIADQLARFEILSSGPLPPDEVDDYQVNGRPRD